MKTHLALSAALAATVSWFAACSSDDDAGGGGDARDTDVANDVRDIDPSDGSETDADATPDAEVVGPTLAMVINELAAAGEPADWVELYNAGPATIDLTGWLMRDDNPAHAYVFPEGTALPASDYLVVSRDETGASGFDFGLGGADALLLYDPNDRLIDQTTWLEGESGAGRSWGRYPNVSGAFKTLLTPTPGEANVDNPESTCGDGVVEGFEVCDGSEVGGLTCASWGWGGGSLTCADECRRISQTDCEQREPGLVLNEVESDDSDRIEIFNGTAEAVDIAGFTVADGGGNTHTIADGVVIEAGGYLILERDVHHTFGLGDEDGVQLLDRELQLVDETAWPDGAAIPGWCRSPDGVGGFRTCDAETFGNPNL